MKHRHHVGCAEAYLWLIGATIVLGIIGMLIFPNG